MRRLREYLEADPQLRADPEAILCDHRPYFCNASECREAAGKLEICQGRNGRPFAQL